MRELRKETEILTQYQVYRFFFLYNKKWENSERRRKFKFIYITIISCYFSIRNERTPKGDGNYFYLLLLYHMHFPYKKWENSERRRKSNRVTDVKYGGDYYNKKWENSERRRKYGSSNSWNSDFLWIRNERTPKGDGNQLNGQYQQLAQNNK